MFNTGYKIIHAALTEATIALFQLMQPKPTLVKIRIKDSNSASYKTAKPKKRMY